LLPLDEEHAASSSAARVTREGTLAPASSPRRSSGWRTLTAVGCN
jgi:hypothetical protein